MNNNESVVFAGLSTLIRNNVLGPIVNFLGAIKNCQVTVDELATVLKLNSIAVPNVGPMMATPQMPGFGPQLSFGGAPPIGYPPVTNAPPSLTTFGGVPMPLASATKSGRAPKAAENVPENEKCQYKITRGRNKDQRCQSRAEPGIPFCKLCKDKKAAASQQAQTGGAPASNVSAPAGPSFPGVQGLPQFGVGMFPGNFPAFAPSGMNQLNPVIGNALAAPEALKIKAQQLANGLLHEINHNLLIRATAPNEYICLGIYDPKTGGNLPLTAEKIEICKSLKMNYVDPTSSNVSGQSLPSINQQLPAILSIGGGLPQFGLPQVPGLGMMNGAMSVTDIRGADDPDYGDDDDGSDEE